MSGGTGTVARGGRGGRCVTGQCKHTPVPLVEGRIYWNVARTRDFRVREERAQETPATRLALSESRRPVQRTMIRSNRGELGAAEKERGARQLTGASFTHSFKVNRTSLDHLLLGGYADIDKLSTSGIISPRLENSRARFFRWYRIGLTGRDGAGGPCFGASLRRTGAGSHDCRRRAMTARHDPWCRGFGLAAGPNPGR